MLSILKSVALLSLASASPVFGFGGFGASPGAEGVATTLIERADRHCAEMVMKFLRSPAGIADPAVRKATSNCFVAEARLLVLGHDRPLLAGKPALSELPAHKLARDGGVDLDPYRALAEMRFVVPGTGTGTAE